MRRVDGRGRRRRPSIEGPAQILGSDGTALGGNGPPTVGTNWIDDPGLNPYQLAEGRAPTDVTPGSGPIEVVVDRGSAEDGHLAVGDARPPDADPVAAPSSGIATFGDDDSMAGITYAGFATTDAVRLLAAGGVACPRSGWPPPPGSRPPARGGHLRSAADGRRSPHRQRAECGAARSDHRRLPRHASTRSLLIFAGIALLVAAFSIHNTFAILAAQRTRESALLRALGATRRQVLGSVVVEALAVGVLASGVGLLAGIGLASG